MAEMRVGEGQEYRTINAALAAAKSGDVILVAPGVYQIARNEGVTGGAVKVDVAGVTIKGDGGAAVLRGTWGPSLLANPFGKSPTMPDARNYKGFADYGGLIQVAADNVTLENITIECVPCAGFDVTAKRGFTLRNCATYWTMNTGLTVKTGGDGIPRSQYATDITVEGCRFFMASCGSLDPAWVARRNAVDAASGAVRMGLIEGPVTFRNNWLAGCWGEGFDVGKGVYGTAAKPVLIEKNCFGDTAHSNLYFNHVDGGDGEPGVIARDNVIFVTVDHPMWQTPPGNAGRQLAFRDERPDKFFTSRNILVERNVIIGGDGLLVSVRDGKAAQNVAIRRNTIVAGAMTEKDVVIMTGGTGVFESNIIIGDSDGDYTRGGAGFTFRGNAWSELPVERMRHEDDVIVHPDALTAPLRPLRLRDRGTAYPETADEYERRFLPDIDLTNYRPRAGGVLALGNIGALGPDGPLPPIEPPPDPPPGEWVSIPAADWLRVRELVATARATLAELAELIQEPANE